MKHGKNGIAIHTFHPRKYKRKKIRNGKRYQSNLIMNCLAFNVVDTYIVCVCLKSLPSCFCKDMSLLHHNMFHCVSYTFYILMGLLVLM